MSFSGHDSGRLERGYYLRVEIAIVLAVAIHALVVLLAPAYVARPYRLAASPLRLVIAGGVGLPGGSVAVRSATAPSPAAPPSARSAPVVVTEQFRAPPPSTPGTGAAASSGPGEGPARGTPGILGMEVGDREGPPPVFYSFDSPPQIVGRVVPEYPAAAKAQAAEGTVVLNANVDERGRVIRVWVAQAKAPEILVESAIDAMYRFRFTPGSQQGIPVTCTVAVPFNFRLDVHL